MLGMPTTTQPEKEATTKIYITKKEIVSGRRHAVAYTAQKKKEKRKRERTFTFFLLSFLFLYIININCYQELLGKHHSLLYIAKKGYIFGIPITTQPESKN